MRSAAMRLPALGLFTLWVLLAACQAAQAGPLDAPAKTLGSTEARKWLLRMHAAAHERNYQGTLVFSADGTLSSARVAHFSEGKDSYERVEALDGRMQQTYRHNDRVYTLWPKTRVAVVEERDPRQASLRPVVELRAARAGQRACGRA
jgi:sigma-E factor negative regulatory protein RseB